MSPRARPLVRWVGLACLALALLPTWTATGAAGESRITVRLGVPGSPLLAWSRVKTDRRTELPGGGFAMDFSHRSETSGHLLFWSSALLLAAACLGRLLRRLPAAPRPAPPPAAPSPPSPPPTSPAAT